MKNHNHQTGATALIEMLAAVALIGVLAYQAIPNTFEIRETAFNANVISGMEILRDAIETRFAEDSLNDPDVTYTNNPADLVLYGVPPSLLTYSLCCFYDTTNGVPTNANDSLPGRVQVYIVSFSFPDMDEEGYVIDGYFSDHVARTHPPVKARIIGGNGVDGV